MLIYAKVTVACMSNGHYHIIQESFLNGRFKATYDVVITKVILVIIIEKPRFSNISSFFEMSFNYNVNMCILLKAKSFYNYGQFFRPSVFPYETVS